MSLLADIIRKYQAEIQADWLKGLASATRRSDLISEAELQEQSKDLLSAIVAGSRSGNLSDLSAGSWTTARDLMTDISTSRAKQGFTSSDTATFILSLKQPVFSRLRSELSKDPDALFQEVWTANLLLDQLALLTTDAFVSTREQIIARQQQELLELSTPVVKLWDGILALPLIGTLDSARTQVVMESLLETVVKTNSRYAIIDITGVPTVDTLVAQHLLKTITAARLMGAECIISGVRPQIAQTIVHLGIDLAQVITKASLADAFALALSRMGSAVTNNKPARKPSAMQADREA
jgi:rsbT co-antagonist protein RsbR